MTAVFGIVLPIAVMLTAVATALKGKWGVFALGFVICVIPWAVGAVRVAKPGSLWARWFYGPRKMQRSMDAYTPVGANFRE